MSDYNSSLPVRTENNGDVVVKLGDGTTPGQQLAIDTSGFASVKQAAEGSASGGTAGTKSVLSGALYNSSAPTLTTGQQVSLQVDVNGNLKTAFTGTVSATGTSTPSDAFANPTNALNSESFLMGWNGTTWDRLKSTTANGLVVDVSRIVAALPTGTNTLGSVKLTDGTNVATVKAASTASIASDTSVVVALSPNSPVPAGTNVIGKVSLQTASADITTSNPLPVTLSASVPGTPVQNYNTSAALAAAGTSNHDYTVTAAKTLSLERVWASASGKLKIEVQIETGVATGLFTSKFVGFNSTAMPNIDLKIESPTQVAAGVKVRVIRTNLDKQAEDVYTTVEGSEI